MEKTRLVVGSVFGMLVCWSLELGSTPSLSLILIPLLISSACVYVNIILTHLAVIHCYLQVVIHLTRYKVSAKEQ